MIVGLEEIESLDRIPVSIVRQAWHDSGLSLTVASKMMGWGSCGTRLKRHLGIIVQGQPIDHVDYETAVLMVRSWNLEPVDYGI